MHTTLQQYGPLVGRILLSLIFIISGINKITGFTGTVGYVESAGLPLPAVLTILTIIIEVGAGLALLIGFRARLAALTLGGFTILAGLFFHLDFSDQMQTGQLLKNLSIAGGMLYVMVYGAGPLSMDSKTSSPTAPL